MLKIIMDALQTGQLHWQLQLNPGYLRAFDFDRQGDTPAKAFAIRGDTENWQAIYELPDLEELVMLCPTKAQVAALARVPRLRRLQITLIRVADIEVLGKLTELEELALISVSGFSDLSPLKKLTKLRSLYIEHLRRVTDFSAIGALGGLKFLCISGSLSANQSIDDLNFLGELSQLEALCLRLTTCKALYPMFGSALKLKGLQEVFLGRTDFPLEEYAFWEVNFPNLPGAKQALAKKLDASDNLYFLGKGSGRVKEGSKNAKEKLAALQEKYEAIKAGIIAGRTLP